MSKGRNAKQAPKKQPQKRKEKAVTEPTTKAPETEEATHTSESETAPPATPAEIPAPPSPPEAPEPPAPEQPPAPPAPPVPAAQPSAAASIAPRLPLPAAPPPKPKRDLAALAKAAGTTGQLMPSQPGMNAAAIAAALRETVPEDVLGDRELALLLGYTAGQATLAFRLAKLALLTAASDSQSVSAAHIEQVRKLLATNMLSANPLLLDWLRAVNAGSTNIPADGADALLRFELIITVPSADAAEPGTPMIHPLVRPEL